MCQSSAPQQANIPIVPVQMNGGGSTREIDNSTLVDISIGSPLGTTLLFLALLVAIGLVYYIAKCAKKHVERRRLEDELLRSRHRVMMSALPQSEPWNNIDEDTWAPPAFIVPPAYATMRRPVRSSTATIEEIPLDESPLERLAGSLPPTTSTTTTVPPAITTTAGNRK